jgi:Domain of unknown function (DUF6265)
MTSEESHMPTLSRLFTTALAAVGAVATASALQAPASVEQVAWLTGCWELASPQQTVEEHWLAPRGQTMLGVSRTVRDERTTEYELVVVRPRNNRLAYEAHPSGQATAVFLSRQVSEASVVFENPEHDFPQRVGYERRGKDSLLAWIEGLQNGRVRRIEYPYRRVACR